MAVQESSLDFTTIRHSDCQLMLSASCSSARCGPCMSYRNTLRAMHSRSINSSNKENSDPSSHANYRYLLSHVKNERLSLLHRQVRISDRRTQCLHDKLEAATRSHGVQVDEELHHEMQDIMKSNADSVSQLQGSFPKIFWQQQMQAASLKDHRGMRWHPLMIKWCLYLRHCSSGCYETLMNLLYLHNALYVTTRT